MGFAYPIVGLLYAAFSALVGASVLVCLPGIWLMVLLGVLNELSNHMIFSRPGGWLQWSAIGVAIAIALLAELLEFTTCAVGAKIGGASKWGMIGALAGSVIGTLAGTVFIAIPVVGTLAGAAIGAALGAIIGELIFAKHAVRGTIGPALGAAGGRIAGTLLKVPLAIVAWIVLMVGAFWR